MCAFGALTHVTVVVSIFCIVVTRLVVQAPGGAKFGALTHATFVVSMFCIVVTRFVVQTPDGAKFAAPTHTVQRWLHIT